MDFLMYLKVFLVGGALCAIGQVLIDYTKLTPARILVCYVTAGVFLGAVGVYKPLLDFAGADIGIFLTYLIKDKIFDKFFGGMNYGKNS